MLATLTGLGAVALVADPAQAVVTLVDAAQPVLELCVLAVQHVLLDAAHVQGADDVLLDFCAKQGGRKPPSEAPLLERKHPGPTPVTLHPSSPTPSLGLPEGETTGWGASASV